MYLGAVGAVLVMSLGVRFGQTALHIVRRIPRDG